LIIQKNIKNDRKMARKERHVVPNSE